MALFTLGLVLFFGVHLVPTRPALRARWAGRSGEDGYKRQFSVIAGAGLLLVVVGYALAPSGGQLFTPSPAARALAPLAMVVSFILLAASHMKTHMRAWLRHPMLLGVMEWAMVHLMANGESKATLLFGAFLCYSVIDLASALRRGTVRPFVPQAKYDAMACAGGVLAALAVMLLHRLLFGVPVVAWSL